MAHSTTSKHSLESHIEESHKLQDLREAQAASNAEHNTTFIQALRENYKAVLWSAAISLTLVMEGYDLALMSNFFGYPTFQRKFGNYYAEEDTWQLTGAWQAGLQNGTYSGVIIGGFINGWASAKFGYRRTLQIALVCLTGFIFISFFAVRIEMLLVGQMLCGLTFGVYATTGPAYASEVCPLALRGYLTVSNLLPFGGRTLICLLTLTGLCQHVLGYGPIHSFRSAERLTKRRQQLELEGRIRSPVALAAPNPDPRRTGP